MWDSVWRVKVASERVACRGCERARERAGEVVVAEVGGCRFHARGRRG